MSELLYAERNPKKLDKAGNYYCKHVMAMTAEGLHSKSSIAMELGHRDRIIDELQHGIHMAISALAMPAGRGCSEAIHHLETALDNVVTYHLEGV